MTADDDADRERARQYQRSWYAARRQSKPRPLPRACARSDCGNMFCSPYPFQRYCSSACWKEGERKRPPIRRCAICECEFVSIHGRKTCSLEHQRELRSLQTQQWQRAKLGLVPKRAVCVICKREFITHATKRITCGDRECKREHMQHWSRIHYAENLEQERARSREKTRRAYAEDPERMRERTRQQRARMDPAKRKAQERRSAAKQRAKVEDWRINDPERYAAFMATRRETHKRWLAANIDRVRQKKRAEMAESRLHRGEQHRQDVNARNRKLRQDAALGRAVREMGLLDLIKEVANGQHDEG